jgi:hypothetical protein
MEDQIILNLAYRNICFDQFFDNSLICYSITSYSLLKGQKLEEQFIQKNVKNIDDYNSKKKLQEDNSLTAIATKKDTIKEWTKFKKIKTSKTLNKNELDELLGTIISNVLEKIYDNKNHGIMNILFSEIIENIVSSFTQLKQLKDLLRKKILEEESKNTSLFKDNLAKDKEFEDYKKQSKKEKKKLSSTINDLKRDKTNLSAQVDSLDKIIAELKNTNNELKMKCEEYSKNQVEYSQSKLPAEYYKLKDLNYDLISKNEIKDKENDDLKKRIEYLEENVDRLSTKINDLKMENNELKLEVSSLKKELKNEREDRKKFEERFPDIIKENIEEMLKNWKNEC